MKDQADILAENEKLTTDLAAVTKERDDARARIATLESEASHNGKLLTEATTRVAALEKENKTLTDSAKTVDARAAEMVAKMGIRKESVDASGTAAGAAGGKKLTLTEECRLAKGLAN